ncbi:MAG: hypothetical protein BGP10_08780 [Rhodanobacter sp. 68-29]|nr:MAG: hypothetical protein ABT17_13875 [Rhodanobacter sp. SCN 69-32]OJY57093.1 MAG: hypothetical protein BGP10_08780 [Rhodanobacter sp. 68-29]
MRAYAVGTVTGRSAMRAFDSCDPTETQVCFVPIGWSENRIVQPRNFLFAPCVPDAADWAMLRSSVAAVGLPRGCAVMPKVSQTAGQRRVLAGIMARIHTSDCRQVAAWPSPTFHTAHQPAAMP